MNVIINPYTLEKHSIFSKDGTSLLKKYIKSYQNGGHFVKVNRAMLECAESFGINLDKAFDIVHKSNMSKLCETEEDAIDTVRIYKEKYANNNSPYDSPAYRRSKDNKYWVVYNESTGKILKNYKYTPANFQELE